MTNPNVFDLYNPEVVAELRSPDIYKGETDFAIVKVSDTDNGDEAFCLVPKSRHEKDLTPLRVRPGNVLAVAECHASGELEIEVRSSDIALSAVAALAACTIDELRLDSANYQPHIEGAVFPQEKFEKAYQQALAA